MKKTIFAAVAIAVLSASSALADTTIVVKNHAGGDVDIRGSLRNLSFNGATDASASISGSGSVVSASFDYVGNPQALGGVGSEVQAALGNMNLSSENAANVSVRAEAPGTTFNQSVGASLSFSGIGSGGGIAISINNRR